MIHSVTNFFSNSSKEPTKSTPVEKSADLPVKIPLQVKKLDKRAKLPYVGSTGAAGYDLHALDPVKIPARGKTLVSTGLSFAIPVGNYGKIAPRSGLALKHSLDVGAGVIDPDYRGEVKILLFNHSDTEFVIDEGTRIAQMIIEKYTPTELVEVDTLDQTERGADGFGSTRVEAKKNVDDSSSNEVKKEETKT